MISTSQLAYTYDGESYLSFPDINCKPKEILLLLGKSGVGKTTLLHLIGGLMGAQSGTIKIGQQHLDELQLWELDKFRGKNIGIIFQQSHFIASISVLENLMIAQTMAGSKSDSDFCLDLLKDLGIAHKAQKKTSDLSQGEKQRLSIARALVNKPKVILADEPTSALDDDNCEEVLNLLSTHAEEIGAALVIVTHDTRLKERIPNQITLQS